MSIVKWISIPALLIASLFACCTARYEPVVDFVICLGALTFTCRAIRLKEYFWAAAFLAIAVTFMPLAVAAKVFLLLGLSCIAALANLLAAFRPRPLPAEL